MNESLVICGPCLGEDSNVRMKRQPNGEECRFCTRPFTTLRWSGDFKLAKMRKTVICESCALARNCCQSCSVDIDYLIPLHLRDAALKLAGLENPFSVESSSRNKEVRAIIGDKLEKQLRAKETEDLNEKNERMRAILSKLAEKLGSAVPKPITTKNKATATLKEVAKIISNLPFGAPFVIPKDENDRSFFVFGFGTDTAQFEISDFFDAHGPLESNRIIQRARCGYVKFQRRNDAEKFAASIALNGLNTNSETAALAIIGNQPVRISWGNPKPLGTNNEDQAKVAHVVIKVMKQLSERDAKQSKPSNRRRLGEKPLKRQKLAKPKKGEKENYGDQKTYQALSKDVEL